MTDAHDNPLGVEGFEFIEYAAPDGRLLHELFRQEGDGEALELVAAAVVLEGALVVAEIVEGLAEREVERQALVQRELP